MVSFKITIADPKTGKTYQKEVKDQQAKPFIGLNIGEAVKGETIDLPGYELLITGGSDYCGFPMRKGILGLRKKIKSKGGVGFRIKVRGMAKRKTVCSHKITETITQINLKVTKEGSKKLTEIFGAKEEEKKEEKKGEAKKEKPKKEIKDEKKEEKPEAKEEDKKEQSKKQEKEEKKEAKEDSKKWFSVNNKKIVVLAIKN